jgi:predicted membrane channel-forming protein YqfA (hemolysin III family)
MIIIDWVFVGAGVAVLASSFFYNLYNNQKLKDHIENLERKVDEQLDPDNKDAQEINI